MTHDDVIIFEKLKLKKNSKTNNSKKNYEIPLNPAKDINITRFTCLRFARQVSPPYPMLTFKYDQKRLIQVMDAINWRILPNLGPKDRFWIQDSF